MFAHELTMYGALKHATPPLPLTALKSMQRWMLASGVRKQQFLRVRDHLIWQMNAKGRRCTADWNDPLAFGGGTVAERTQAMLSAASSFLQACNAVGPSDQPAPAPEPPRLRPPVMGRCTQRMPQVQAAEVPDDDEEDEPGVLATQLRQSGSRPQAAGRNGQDRPKDCFRCGGTDGHLSSRCTATLDVCEPFWQQQDAARGAVRAHEARVGEREDVRMDTVEICEGPEQVQVLAAATRTQQRA
jgi:hypothetical protein